MVKLLIDSVQCDLNEGFTLPDNLFNFNHDDLADVGRLRQGDSITLRIPATRRNDTVLGFAADSHTAVRFNSSYHKALIISDGCELFGGVCTLEAIEAEPLSDRGGHAVSYRIRISDGAAAWAKSMATTPLCNTPLDYEATLNGESIRQSWEEDSVVRYLPVYRDEYIGSEQQDTLYPPQRVLTVGDYHPFISAVSILKSIFAAEGFTVRSRFLDSALAKNLYISGCTASDTASAARLMAVAGFCAGRVSSPTTVADYSGRAYLSSLVLANSLGNIVESADSEVDAAFFNNGNTLSIGDDGVTYTPRVACSVAFDFSLKYTTDYRILSRERLQGFDSVYVDAGCDIRFGILNPFQDRRGELAGSTNYLCTIFGFAEGEAFRIEWEDASGALFYKDITARATKVVSATDATDCRLLKLSADGSYAEYDGDWALYDGYVSEQGSREVEVTLRTAPEQLSPSRAKSFARMYIYGAEPGQSITLSAECRLQPVFTSSPGLGSEITAEGILQHDASQLTLLAALQQMFNLRIYTDKRRGEVWIEPRDDFFSDNTFDWSHRVVLSEQMCAEELAADTGARRTLAFSPDGGGAVSRFNNHHQTALGEWSAMTDSYIAKEMTLRLENPLFCPTLSATGVFADAPSAALLSTGNRDADEVGDSGVRIVRWVGMQPLPATERWGFPSDGDSYPLAAFHYPAQRVQGDGAAIVGDIPATGPEESFTLCFEERDQTQGLHTYYDKEWRVEALRRRISLSVRISPEELTALRNIGTDGPNLTSLFSLEADRQSNLFRLHSIEGYDFERGIARMVFVHNE